MKSKPGPIQTHTVFQMVPPRGYTSVHDAREAYNLAKAQKKAADKDAIYECMGLDRKRVEKYLHIVESLDRSYKRKDDNTAIINKIINLMKIKKKDQSKPFPDWDLGNM